MDLPLSIRRTAVRSAARAAAAAVLLCGALAVPSATAARAESRSSAPVAAPVAAQIEPHRALYRMTLAQARNSSKVNDVRGTMAFEWADACDGWTTEQRFQLRFAYTEGEVMDMATTYATWESKDGLAYRFNVRKLVNGEVDEEVRGDARLTRTGGAGMARFVKPEAKELELAPGTLFPTAHTLAILEHALRKERMFAAVVFDGADADGATEVSAVIANATRTAATAPEPLRKDREGWPVRMAFFPLDSDAETPEYEMGIRLLRNGVVDSMRIDYGDFIVDAVLEKLEALPKARC